jgi:hypothetical protein
MILAPQMMATVFGPGAVAAFLFFISLGIFQIICIGIILKSSRPSLFVLAILGNVVSIVIYFVSTSGMTILGVPPQPLIPFAVLIKALEAVFIAASGYVLRTGVSSARA